MILEKQRELILDALRNRCDSLTLEERITQIYYELPDCGYTLPQIIGEVEKNIEFGRLYIPRSFSRSSKFPQCESR